MSDGEAEMAGPGRAGAREWVGLAVLALPLLVLAVDISVLYLAAPALTVALRPSATEQLWILDIYGFVIAGFLLTMGTVGDRVGRRRLLLIGAAAFAAASLLAAFAPTPAWLIGARAALGVAGATLMPSTLALITTMFPDLAQRRFAVAVWMTTFSAGTALGPLIGGLVLQRWWWGAVFLLGIPPMLLLVTVGPWLLPEQRRPRTEIDSSSTATEVAPRVDLLSVGLSLAAMLPLAYGVKAFAAYGATPDSAFAVLVGLVSGAGFVRRQRRLAVPMLEVSLFIRSAFTASVSVLLLGLLAINGLMYLLPQYLQLVAGRSVLAAGLWLLPVTAVAVAGSLITPGLAGRLGNRTVLVVGALIAAVAALGLVLVEATTHPSLVVGLVAVAVLGICPATVLGTDLVISSVPTERAGSAAAISETAGELGVALDVAVTGSIIAATYTMTLALPPGLSPAADRAARDGLAPALDSAASLPTSMGDAVAAASREAFTAGLSTVGVTAAALLLLVAALARAALRPRHH